MLKTRVLTAAVLAPPFVLGVLFLPNFLFSILVGVIVLVGAWEWTHLSGYHDNQWKALAVVVICALMIAGYRYRDSVDVPVFVLASTGWLVIAAALFHQRRSSPLAWPGPVRWLSGVLVLVPAWLALSSVQHSLPEAALMLCVLIWTADTGAYFSGRRWGRRRLAPAFSPAKTVEGVLGAVAASVVVSAAFGWYWGLDGAGWSGLTLCSIIVVVLSVFGDLFESNWKRLANLKDSGGLVPGHGGVLDRIDSMTAAAPVFALSWLWWFESAAA